MKNPFKHAHTPNPQPSQQRLSSTSTALCDLTDADLKQVQGGKDSISRVSVEFYVETMKVTFQK
ncbi:MAG TPA: hypothetical protein VH540_27795 [Ktedonobacterales bacterium]